jgi:hypothetical protein
MALTATDAPNLSNHGEEHAMHPTAGIIIGLTLVSCATRPDSWQRVDGRPIDPAQYRQAELICDGVAQNAAAGVPQPGSTTSMSQSTTVNVAPASSNPYVVNSGPSGSSYQPPQVDFSGVGDSIAHAGQQWRVRSSTFNGCMAQAGYIPAR